MSAEKTSGGSTLGVLEEYFIRNSMIKYMKCILIIFRQGSQNINDTGNIKNNTYSTANNNIDK